MSKNAVDSYIEDILTHQHIQTDQSSVQLELLKTSNLKKVEKTLINKVHVSQIKVEYYPSPSLAIKNINDMDQACLGESLNIFED